MAMVKVCCQNLTSRHCYTVSRPAFSCDLQLSRSARASFFVCGTTSPAIPGNFSHFVSMETGERPHAMSDQSAKATEEEQGGGSGDGGGSGAGRHGDGDSFDGNPKGDDPISPFGWYMLLLNKHPVTTKAITSALLTLFGDFVCQLIIEKNERINFTRLGIFTFLGLVLVGPTLHFWYLTLSKLVPGPGLWRAGARLALDQFLFSPIFIGVFISALMTLEGHSSDILPKLKQDWINVVVTNWKIWIPFQFINFLVVPQQLQVLVANIIALVWNTYLSFAAHKSIIPPAQKDSITS